MHSFEYLSKQFSDFFSNRHFPEHPASLYEPNEYFLGLNAKRIRPVLCLMGNELFDEISPDAWHVATAIELFHNFTLIHDDIMDNAPLRRGVPTLHAKYGNNTALLAGDVMLVTAYSHLNKISGKYIFSINSLFNKTAREVCEGQQLDMDFEKAGDVSYDAYLEMIRQKTSVLLAGSLGMGAILGGAGERNQQLLYQFGIKLGIAFQIQDDYLDAFGDPGKFGKQVGGDILANKKTFLLVHALQTADASTKQKLDALMNETSEKKVPEVLSIFRQCKVDAWALEQKNKFLDEAFVHLEDIAVLSKRKDPIRELAQFLVRRDH